MLYLRLDIFQFNPLFKILHYLKHLDSVYAKLIIILVIAWTGLHSDHCLCEGTPSTGCYLNTEGSLSDDMYSEEEKNQRTPIYHTTVRGAAGVSPGSRHGPFSQPSYTSYTNSQLEI